MALAYTAPTWTNGSGQGISASALQAISNCIEGLVQGSDKAVSSISMDAGVFTLTFADGSVETVTATNMKSISSITKTSESGLVDTYTIQYDDGTTDSFTVTNGQDGTVPIVKYSETLTAGSTSVTFSNITTTENSVIEVGTSAPGLEYITITNSGDSYTVTYDAQVNDVTVYLIVTEVV